MATEIVESNDASGVDDMEALYERVMTCEPAFPPHEMEQLADLVQSNEHVGRPWRVAALFGAKGGPFYRELSEDEEQAKLLAEVVGPLADGAKLLRRMAEIMECVSTRIMLAGCNHEHFVQWMQDADAENGAEVSR